MVKEKNQTLPSGSLLLLATGLVMGGIANISLLVEILSERWLAQAIGVPGYISLPLGVGTGVIMFLSWRAKHVKGWLSTVLFSTYFSLFFYGLFGMGQ